MSSEEIASAFVQHFYTTLDSNPAGLHSLYQSNSTLTFEGTAFTGADAIIQKYQSSGSVQHNIPQLTKDSQVTANGALLIVVTGQLQIGGQGNALLFSHTFELVATSPGNYYIHNELFRLIYG